MKEFVPLIILRNDRMFVLGFLNFYLFNEQTKKKGQTKRQTNE